MDNHVQQTVSEKGRVMGGLNKDCTRNNKHSHMETIRAVSPQGRRSHSASSGFSLYSSLGVSLSSFLIHQLYYVGGIFQPPACL